MAENEEHSNTGSNDLIDVSEFESEFDEDVLTEIERDEEVTPIRQRGGVKRTAPDKKIALPETARGGMFIATMRERFSAFLIDSFVLFYLYWIVALLYSRFILGSFDAPIPYSGWQGFALHGAFLLLCFLYYFMLEGIFLCTVGKFVCWMSVGKKNFEPASLLATFVRNVLRLLDYVLIFPVVFIMEKTKYRQRIGDIIAGTTVVKKYGTIPEAYEIPPEMMASATGRTIALIVDVVFFLAFLLGYVLIWNPKAPFLSMWLLLLTPLAVMTYFVLIEMATETSPGKWLTGYIVCHENGNRLTISGSIVRTLWRLFDTNPVGLLCLFISSRRQRPGDLAAGTIILKHKRSIKGAASILIAALAAACTIYLGMMNQTNILSPKFRWNFLPKLSFLGNIDLGGAEEEELGLKNFRFAADDPNNLRVPPTYNEGENVYVIFELVGYTRRDRKVWLQEDLSVTYPDGTVGLRQDNIVDYRQVVKGTGPIELTNNIALPEGLAPGEYQVNITIRDKFAGNEVEASKNFYVRRPLAPRMDE